MESLLLKLCRGGYVCESKKSEILGMLSSEIMLPWCGVDELKCENIKKNSGLYTQCSKMKEGCEYCKVCARSIEKNGGVSKYGRVSDREKCSIMEYVDPSSGKKPSSYSEYMKKNNLTMEEVEKYGKMCGVVVPSCHFEENKSSRGRPKKEVGSENVDKKKRGRPKKEKQVVSNGSGEDLIASLCLPSLPSLPTACLPPCLPTACLPTAELRCPEIPLSADEESNIESVSDVNIESISDVNIESVSDEITNKEVRSIPSPAEESEAPQPSADKPSADTADDDEEETVVVKFDILGITYLKSQDNVIYDMNTHDAMGVWNEETSEIDELPDEEDEEEEE